MKPIEDEVRRQHAGRAVACGVPIGSPVTTTEGEIPVEFLATGDLISAPDGSFQTLRQIAVKTERCEPIQISAGSFSLDGSVETMILPPDQHILVRDWRATVMFGAREAVVPVHRLVDEQYVNRQSECELFLFELFFDRPQLITSGGLRLAMQSTAPETIHSPFGSAFLTSCNDQPRI